MATEKNVANFTFRNAFTLNNITKRVRSADSWETEPIPTCSCDLPWKVCLHCGSACVSGASFDSWMGCCTLYIPSTNTQTPAGGQRGNQNEMEKQRTQGKKVSRQLCVKLWTDEAVCQLSQPIFYIQQYTKSRNINTNKSGNVWINTPLWLSVFESCFFTSKQLNDLIKHP